MLLIPALLGLVSQLVPTLVGLFAGPKGEDVAQKVIEVAQAVTGTTNQDDAHTAIKADPEKLEALRCQLAQIAVDGTKAAQADTASARSMAVAFATTGSALQFGPLLISLVVMAIFGCVVMGWAPHPDPGMERLVDDALVLVLGFWLGSSARAPSTDALLANSIPAHVAVGGVAARPLGR